MELVSIENINEQYLFYSCSRSVLKWIRKKGITVIKLGKRYFIQKEDFENMLNELIDSNKLIENYAVKATKNKPTDQHEKIISARLLDKINVSYTPASK